MPGIEDYFAKVPKHVEPTRPRQASGRPTAGAVATTTKVTSTSEKPMETLSTKCDNPNGELEPLSKSCDRNKHRHNLSHSTHQDHHQKSSGDSIDCDNDDEVIIIEDLSRKTRPNPARISISDPSKPRNELLQVTMQSKTDRRIVATIKTPNVPKVKGSFFHRKYREITRGQLTPTTPKLENATPLRNRHKSGNYHPYTKDYHTTKSARSNKNRSANEDSIVSDYSTPTTTRTLLTPTSMRGSKKRPSRFMYKPLELDNESSSESTDSIMRRHDALRRMPQEFKAIEAPPPPFAPEPAVEAKLSADKTSHPDTQENVISDVESDESKREKQTIIQSNEPREIDDCKLVSECITPPITPEKTKDNETCSSPGLPTFVPGNCNIDEVLGMYETNEVKLGDITKQNIKVMRRINQAIFPVNYDEKFYKDVLEAGELARLAYYKDIVVGTVCCRLEQNNNECLIYIMTLGCLFTYRRLGIGTTMLKHVLEYASKKGIDSIYLHVQTTNTGAVEFYKKFGFKIVDTKEDYYKRIESSSALVLMKQMSTDKNDT